MWILCASSWARGLHGAESVAIRKALSGACTSGSLLISHTSKRLAGPAQPTRAAPEGAAHTPTPPTRADAASWRTRLRDARGLAHAGQNAEAYAIFAALLHDRPSARASVRGRLRVPCGTTRRRQSRDRTRDRRMAEPAARARACVLRDVPPQPRAGVRGARRPRGSGRRVAPVARAQAERDGRGAPRSAAKRRAPRPFERRTLGALLPMFGARLRNRCAIVG